MSFNSYIFVLLFLPIAVVIYHMINKAGHFLLGKWFLLFVSLWFYGYAGLRGLIIVCGLTVLNYLAYILIGKLGKKRLICGIGIGINILALFFFKYFISTEITINKYAGTHFAFVNIIVPLGISFITFSQISFLVDNLREYKKVSALDYFLYVLFFPKVTVGPIALSSDFIPQFNDSIRKEVNFDNISKGIMAFAFGLSKKVLIADLMSKYADYGFMNITGLGPVNALIVMLAYTMQIYFDFSGFCDMAQGICLMLNFDLPINFNSPYRALSIGEFWDRWHITLTKFFTKYIYIPLGGSRKGKVRTYINIMLVFLISGIWHGAAMTFVVWGLLHGIGSCISRAFKDRFETIPKFIRWAVTFLYVNIAWVFFRAATLKDALNFLKELLPTKWVPVDVQLIAKATPKEYELFQWIFAEFTSFNTYYTGLPVILLVLAFAIYASIKMKNTNERISVFVANKKTVIVTVLLLVMSIVSLSEVSAFIYVNF